MREKYKTVEEMKVTSINQIASMAQLALLSKKDTLLLIMKFSDRLSD